MISLRVRLTDGTIISRINALVNTQSPAEYLNSFCNRSARNLIGLSSGCTFLSALKAVERVPHTATDPKVVIGGGTHRRGMTIRLVGPDTELSPEWPQAGSEEHRSGGGFYPLMGRVFLTPRNLNFTKEHI